MFYEAIDNIMPHATVHGHTEEMEPIDEVVMSHRMTNLNNSKENNIRSPNKIGIPPELLRR